MTSRLSAEGGGPGQGSMYLAVTGGAPKEIRTPEGTGVHPMTIDHDTAGAPAAHGPSAEPRASATCASPLDVHAIRGHFAFPGRGRVVTNNAASTQPAVELLELYASLGAEYENVHRGQSAASRAMTARFEASYDTIAQFVGAPSRACIALYKNTTEAINPVMYALLSELP
jgi:aminotransferase class V